MDILKLKTSKVKPGFVFFSAACLVFAISILDINQAFIMGFIAIPASIAIFVKTVKRNKSLTLLSKNLTYFGCVLLLAASPVGCSYNTSQTKNKLQPLISQLDEFKSTHGTYPADLSVLHQPIPQCHSPQRNVLYIHVKELNEYSLTCVIFGFNKLTYNSHMKSWANFD